MWKISVKNLIDLKFLDWLNHTVLFNDQEKKNVKESLKKVKVKEADKSTLGDLDVLADLKIKMVNDEKKKK